LIATPDQVWHASHGNAALKAGKTCVCGKANDTLHKRNLIELKEVS